MEERERERIWGSLWWWSEKWGVKENFNCGTKGFFGRNASNFGGLSVTCEFSNWNKKKGTYLIQVCEKNKDLAGNG